MPKYTLVHGGLRMGATLHVAGTANAEVELTREDADELNRTHETVRLSSVVAAEAEAEEKKKKAVEAAEKKALAEAEAEEKKKGGKS